MATKTKTVRHTETWRAKLGNGGVDGVTGEPIEGVRLGWCWHDGQFYKPVEVPPYVADFLELYIVPADYLWPFYGAKSFKSLESLMAGIPTYVRVIDTAESIIEFDVDVETVIEEPIIVEVDWDNCYVICGGDTPSEDDVEWVDVVYFDVGEVDDKWYMSATLDTLSYTGDLATDYGPYETKDEALLAGVDTAFDWFITCDLNPLYLSASEAPELQRVIASNNMSELFDGRNLREPGEGEDE